MLEIPVINFGNPWYTLCSRNTLGKLAIHLEIPQYTRGTPGTMGYPRYIWGTCDIIGVPLICLGYLRHAWATRNEFGVLDMSFKYPQCIWGTQVVSGVPRMHMGYLGCVWGTCNVFEVHVMCFLERDSQCPSQFTLIIQKKKTPPFCRLVILFASFEMKCEKTYLNSVNCVGLIKGSANMDNLTRLKERVDSRGFQFSYRQNWSMFHSFFLA